MPIVIKLLDEFVEEQGCPYLVVPPSQGALPTRAGEVQRTELVFKNGARALPSPEGPDRWHYYDPPKDERQRGAVVLRYVELKLAEEEAAWERAYRYTHQAIELSKRFPGSVPQPQPRQLEQLEAGSERIAKLKAKRAELLELTRDTAKEARDAARNAHTGAIVGDAERLAARLKAIAARKAEGEVE